MLGSDRNRVLCPPRFCADWSVSALSFSSLASSLVRIAGIQLGYCATWPPSYGGFPSRVLIGYSFELQLHWKEIFCLASRNSSTQRPFGTHSTSRYRRQTALLMFLWTPRHGCRTKSKIPVFSRLRIFEAKIPGWHLQRSRSRLITSLPCFVSFMRDSP